MPGGGDRGRREASQLGCGVLVGGAGGTRSHAEGRGRVALGLVLVEDGVGLRCPWCIVA